MVVNNSCGKWNLINSLSFDLLRLASRLQKTSDLQKIIKLTWVENPVGSPIGGDIPRQTISQMSTFIKYMGASSEIKPKTVSCNWVNFKTLTAIISRRV